MNINIPIPHQYDSNHSQELHESNDVKKTYKYKERSYTSNLIQVFYVNIDCKHEISSSAL